MKKQKINLNNLATKISTLNQLQLNSLAWKTIGKATENHNKNIIFPMQVLAAVSKNS